MKYAVLLGRVLYSAIFLMSAPEHFTSKMVSYAAAKGVPMPQIAVPAAGAIAFLGALSILLGYRARTGAWLIIVFLVPVTIMIHNFWAISDPAAARMQQINFMKNLSMLGAALMFSYLGAGPLSLDARRSSSSS